MENRACVECWASLRLYRSQAATCSARCRKRFSRRKFSFPAEMTSRRRWVRRDANKAPLTGAGRYASSTNSKTWASFDDTASSKVGVGMGFVLGDGIGCWDLDHCFTGGKLADWAREALASITERVIFTEVSQSSEGLHVFVEAPEGKGHVIRDGRNIEFYSTGRYIAVTGNAFAL